MKTASIIQKMEELIGELRASEKTPFDIRNIPGFRALLPGEEPHRQDFTEADLPEGWRLLLNDEETHSVDEFRPERQGNWMVLGGAPNELDEMLPRNFYRTCRPLPSAPDWDFETAPLVLKVKRKSDGALFRATSYPNGVLLADGCFESDDVFQASYATLATDYVQLDGTPCRKGAK